MMLKIYFVFLLVGLIGLLSSMLFDGDSDGDLADGADAGDSFDDSPKVFSLRVIFAFLLAFSIGGGAMYYSDKAIAGQIIVGLLSGVATGAFVWWLTKILYNMQGASNVDSDTFIGKTGDIVVGTTPGGKAKVRVSTISGPMELLCKEANDKKLKNGDLVKISGKMGTLLLVNKQ
jgi:membrane protein implicated in regulation of membrane protease activity